MHFQYILTQKNGESKQYAALVCESMPFHQDDVSKNRNVLNA